MKRIFRTAAVTTEQVVRAGRCLVHRIIPEVASIAGTITLRNDSQIFPIMGTVTPTGVDTNGSLAAGTWHVKVTAIDAYGRESAPSADCDGGALIDANNHVTLVWDAIDNAVSYRVYYKVDGAVTGAVAYFATTTNSYDLTTVTGKTDATLPTVRDATSTMRICPIATLQAGIDLGGVLFDNGLTIQLSNSADTTGIVYEVIA